jgi:hypothetical protein
LRELEVSEFSWNPLAARARLAAMYAACWIPGNFLVEGSLVADVAIKTFVPFEAHFS